MSTAQSGTTQDGRVPRTRHDPSTTNSPHSTTTGSPQLDHHPPLEVCIPIHSFLNLCSDPLNYSHRWRSS
jgi:hypothetical protein